MEELEKIIGYKFKNIELLQTAVTHSSYAYIHNIASNERLEFLGDSILGFIVAEFLYKNVNVDEGKLTKIRANIVNYEFLSDIITKNNLDKFILTSPLNMVKSNSVKCDFFEAILGAMYLDGGLKCCETFVYNFLNLNNENLDNIINCFADFKTQLQEMVQAKKGVIEYRFKGQEGKPNDAIFEIELYINNQFICSAKEKSKQKAENLCAKIAIENFVNLFD